MRCFGCAWVFPAKGGGTMGRLIRILALVSAGVLGLSACGTSTSSGKIGGTVHILGTWTGTEKDSFDAVMKPFTDQTGVKISYDPKAFQAKGYQVPKTWDELMTLQNKIKSDGGKPWCVALESKAASGWPGSDWHKEIVLSQSGTTIYDNWWQGKQKWTSPEIKQAWTTWGQILGSADSNVYGGKQYMVSTTFGDGGQGLFTSPPKCYMFNQGSFITSFFDAYTPKPTAGTDYAVFPLPDVSTANTGAHVVAGDAFVITKDTPQARALLKYLATAEAQDIWVKRGGGKIAINNQVSLSNYPDPIPKPLARVVVDTKIARYDAGDLMPSDMQAAYWAAVLKFVTDQSKLDAILAELDKTQATAYASP